MNKDLMLNDLEELIAIKSTLSEAGGNAPFGAGCRQALDWFLQKAESYGLKTGEIDGFAGWAEFGEGEHCIAALCHLDVVPAGEGWASDPFTLRRENGLLLGRGVADDKGAVIMCLHALKRLKESGANLTHRVRIIVGLNEEHGSACMKHYVKHCEIPLFSFVPDAEFPIINSEKGILHIGVRIPLDKFFESNIAHISGGNSFNVVPDSASVSIFKDSPLLPRLIEINGSAVFDDEIFTRPQIVGQILAAGHRVEDFHIKTEQDVITISAVGTAGHAMAPHLADNAVWKLFAFLGALEKSPLVECMMQFFCTSSSTARLGINKSDEQSGENTINLGIIEVDDDSLYFTLDLRLCVSSKQEDVRKSILDALPRGSKIEVKKYSDNLFVDKDSPLVRTLLGVYSEVTGRETFCLQCGGGTYARELPNAVAFGPTFPGVVTNLHKIDESLPEEDFFLAALVYLRAFERLAK